MHAFDNTEKTCVSFIYIYLTYMYDEFILID